MIRQFPPPETDSAPTHPGEVGRLVLYRDGLLSWEIDQPHLPASVRDAFCGGYWPPVERSTTLRLTVERHSLWHSRLSAAKPAGLKVPIRGRRWLADMRGRFMVADIHEGGGGPVGVELLPVEPVQWYAVDG